MVGGPRVPCCGIPSSTVCVGITVTRQSAFAISIGTLGSGLAGVDGLSATLGSGTDWRALGDFEGCFVALLSLSILLLPRLSL